jgi:spermidine synthase
MSRVKRTTASTRAVGSKGERLDNDSKASLPERRNRTKFLTARTFGFALLLFGSGAAALVYQVLWIKQISLVVGVEVYAVTTAVSAFFAGLALGGAIFGRIADRTSRPLRLYAKLELGVAAAGIAATIALAHTAAPFAILEARVGLLAWPPLFLLVAIPAFLMGGTLPVLARTQAPQPGEVARSGGTLYAANTAGAVCGALVTPFFLLPRLGVRGASFAAGLINIGFAIAAIYLDRSAEAKPVLNPAPKRELPSVERRVVILIYALAGGIALGYEVIWSQAVIPLMSTRSFAFAIVLATYLTGLVLGSAVYSRFADRVRDPWGVFGVLIALAGLLALLSVSGIGKWFVFLQWHAGEAMYTITASEMLRMCARFFAAAFMVVFPPAVLLGAAFPAALRLAVEPDHVGRDLGAVVALNTAGGILGTLLTGFVLLPKLGLLRSLEILAIAAALLGFIAVARARVTWNFTRWLTLAVGIVILLIAYLTPRDKLPALIPKMHGSAGDIVFYEEDPGGTVAIADVLAGQQSFRRLYIQGVSNSGDSLPSIRYMRLQALLPLLIHNGEPHSVLVIGLGTGITAGATLRYPGLTRRVSDELLPGVVHSAKLFRGNFEVDSAPGIEIRLRDGRMDLLRSSERYDLITLEPPPPSASGVVNLYSSDFYALASKRLQPNGILAQWLPLPTQNDADTRSLVRSFLNVFPGASLWTTELHEMLLVGSLAPIELDYKRISARFAQPQVAEALREVGIASPAALMATWVTDRTGLEKYASNAPPVTDDHPRIEYAPWVRREEITRVLPELLALWTAPPIRGADDQFWNDLAGERELLLNFYAAGIAAYNGDRERWERLITSVNSHDHRNPYYRWIAGGE